MLTGKILCLYATREGQTQKVAHRIVDHLEARGAAGDILNAHDRTAVKQIKLEQYELLIAAASLHAGSIESEMVGFINQHEQQIRRMKRSFFLVLLTAATKDPELRQQGLTEAAAHLNRQLAVPFDDVEMIAGALRNSQYSMPVRWILKKIAGKAGEETRSDKDYEYTDWNQVKDYAERLLAM